MAKPLILNRYKPLGKAGQGGFATVTAAWDTRIQRKVAIKAIPLPQEEVAAVHAALSKSAHGVAGAFSAGPDGKVVMPLPDEVPEEFADEFDDGLEPLSPLDDDGFDPLYDDDLEPLPPLDDDTEESLLELDSKLVVFPWETEEEARKRVAKAAKKAQSGQSGRTAQSGQSGRTAQSGSFTLAKAQAKTEEVPVAALPAGTLPEGAPEDDTATEDVWLAHVPGLDEARTAARLLHPNIVAVYDFEIADDTAYLIMEYVEGVTLSQILKEHDEDLSLDSIATVLHDVSAALTAAHKAQVFHLDIKPDNIMIDASGAIKVTDFGLATLADQRGHGTTGGGTIGYMPLEQMRQESLDARTDEWALASVLYEMLSGDNPFLAKTLKAAEAAIENAELILPSLCWEGLTTDIDDVMFYALDPDPAERYRSVAEFAKELAPHLGDPEVGRKELAAFVAAPEEGEEEFDEEPAEPAIPLRDRITPFMRTVAARMVGAAGSALIGFEALANNPLIGSWDSPAMWVTLALLTVVGAVLPHLGALVSMLLLAVTMFFMGVPVVGVLLIAAAGTWWWFMGRMARQAAALSVGTPLAGAAGLGAVMPLAAGFCLFPVPAMCAAALSVLLATIFAAAGSLDLLNWGVLNYWDFNAAASVSLAPSTQLADASAALTSTGAVTSAYATMGGRLLMMITKPAFWCIAASWILAAGVVSLFRTRPSRRAALTGVVVGAAVLLAGLILGAWLGSGQVSWAPNLISMAATIMAAAVMVFMCNLIPDYEWAEDEDPEALEFDGFTGEEER